MFLHTAVLVQSPVLEEVLTIISAGAHVVASARQRVSTSAATRAGASAATRAGASARTRAGSSAGAGNADRNVAEQWSRPEYSAGAMDRISAMNMLEQGLKSVERYLYQTQGFTVAFSITTCAPIGTWPNAQNPVASDDCPQSPPKLGT
jgi:hypothetical protein